MKLSSDPKLSSDLKLSSEFPKNFQRLYFMSFFKQLLSHQVNAHNCVVLTRTGAEITDNLTKRTDKKAAILDSALGQRQSGEIVKNRKFVYKGAKAKPCSDSKTCSDASQFEYCEDKDNAENTHKSGVSHLDAAETRVQGIGSPIKGGFQSTASCSNTNSTITGFNGARGSDSLSVGNVRKVQSDGDGLSSVSEIIDSVSHPFDMPELGKSKKKRKVTKK